MKVVISPYDANSLLGDYRKDVYWATYGGGYFYEKQEAFNAYDARLSAILNYKGATSGQVWKNSSSAILSINLQVGCKGYWPLIGANCRTQNEPMTVDSRKAYKGGDAHSWICGRAKHIRATLGANNPILVSTGGIGGNISWGCTFLKAATEYIAVDIISTHQYARYPGNWKNATSGYIQSSNSKLAYLEE
ncbi:hypothetical protein GQ44DRAFT_777910 [Phaeosphaeriaceae sp. PMI808]|nr:hypothetical protein GQ44DRAFT_777910 [Phaeosphaeriaceae sp. PMI808]